MARKVSPRYKSHDSPYPNRTTVQRVSFNSIIFYSSLYSMLECTRLSLGLSSRFLAKKCRFTRRGVRFTLPHSRRRSLPSSPWASPVQGVFANAEHFVLPPALGGILLLVRSGNHLCLDGRPRIRPLDATRDDSGNRVGSPEVLDICQRSHFMAGRPRIENAHSWMV